MPNGAQVGRRERTVQAVAWCSLAVSIFLNALDALVGLDGQVWMVIRVVTAGIFTVAAVLVAALWLERRKNR